MRVNLSELRIGRRDLRMISGMVMLCYLASHLANHALGLVSLDAAEIVLSGAVQFWGNPLVTVILYGAAAVHVALAIVSVYERRTFRLPPLELLRIALGLWLPVMLIGHAVTTRLEYELVGAPSTYTRVVSDLWARNGEWPCWRPAGFTVVSDSTLRSVGGRFGGGIGSYCLAWRYCCRCCRRSGSWKWGANLIASTTRTLPVPL